MSNQIHAFSVTWNTTCQIFTDYPEEPVYEQDVNIDLYMMGDFDGYSVLWDYSDIRLSFIDQEASPGPLYPVIQEWAREYLETPDGQEELEELISNQHGIYDTLNIH